MTPEERLQDLKFELYHLLSNLYRYEDISPVNAWYQTDPANVQRAWDAWEKSWKE